MDFYKLLNDLRNPVLCFHELTGMQLKNIQGPYFLREMFEIFYQFKYPP